MAKLEGTEGLTSSDVCVLGTRGRQGRFCCLAAGPELPVLVLARTETLVYRSLDLVTASYGRPSIPASSSPPAPWRWKVFGKGGCELLTKRSFSMKIDKKCLRMASVIVSRNGELANQFKCFKEKKENRDCQLS